MNVPRYDTYFQDGLKLPTPGEPGSPAYLRLHRAGELVITTGALVACDPFLAVPDLEPFVTAVPVGRHPVTLCVAEYHKKNKPYDERVALARVDFCKGPVKTWTLATLPGQTLKSLEADQYFGYVSETGTGCFTDARGAQALSLALDTDDEFADSLRQALETNYRVTRSWASRPLDPKTGANVVMFSSGDGAGSYPTFFGHDGKGQVAAVLTDFLLISYA